MKVHIYYCFTNAGMDMNMEASTIDAKFKLDANEMFYLHIFQALFNHMIL